VSNLYVIRTPSGLRKIGHSRAPRRRAVELGCHNTIDERGVFTLEYERECFTDPRDRERVAHMLLLAKRFKLEYFAVSLEEARKAVDFAISSEVPSIAAAPPDEPPPRNGRLEMWVDAEFAKRIDDWRRRQPHLPSRAEALRTLVAFALDAEEADA
jgi:hypothetical protein